LKKREGIILPLLPGAALVPRLPRAAMLHAVGVQGQSIQQSK
jgi:hypothetical protein